jgi:beta-galactosidase
MNSKTMMVGDQELFLYSGEFHYFRTPNARWEDSLLKMKAAHCNAVSIYVPWNWHEPIEGQLDLTGKTDPQRDLGSVLRLLESLDLFAIVRPGPFITSEWRHGGIPDWLLTSHPEILARDVHGQTTSLDVAYPPITYHHPVYMAYVERWYHAVIDLIKPHLHSAGGCVIHVQVDDEPTYFNSLRLGPTAVDYNPVIVGDGRSEGLFHEWLRAKFGQIERLNHEYTSQYMAFGEVTPPDGEPLNRAELLRCLDWYYFKLNLINEHMGFLYHLLRDGGIDVPISMLFPYLLPQAAFRFVEYAKRQQLDYEVTIECYPSLFGPSVVTEDRVGYIVGIHEIYKSWLQGTEIPLISMESQSAMAFHLPPGGMEELYLLTLAHGVNGLNFYMMVGGENPPGYTVKIGPSYDISAPIGIEGQIRPHYQVIQRLGQFLETHGARLAHTQTLSDLALGYYEPYEAVSLQGNSLEWGFQESYRDFNAHCFGVDPGPTLMTLMSLSGLSYQMVNLETVSLADLAQTAQLWVPGLDFMARSVQELLVSYVQDGGHLVMFPHVPNLDEHMRPCDILRSLFSVRPIDRRPGTQAGRLTPLSFVRVGDIQEMLVYDYPDTFELPSGVQPTAFDTRTGKPCAYTVQFGQGQATLLGFKPRYAWDAHLHNKRFVNQIADMASVRRHAMADSWEFVVTERVGEGYAYVFVVNPVDLSHGTRIAYTDPVDGKTRYLPELLDQVVLPRQGGLILAVRCPIPGAQVEVLHSTSQLQSWESGTGRVSLDLYGPAATLGETSLRVAEWPSRVTIDDKPPLQEVHREDTGELLITYAHTDRPVHLVLSWG